MSRPINSDQLGEKGEQRFAELCADAELICNKSNRDRSGWDFIVEFPFPHIEGGESLDKRRQPPTCIAQVKTVWTGGRNIKLRLSSAERLAKQTQMACVFVFTVKKDLEFEALYCIHIIGDVLSKILKKLREWEATNPTKINKNWVSINIAESGSRTSVLGSRLRQSIESAAGITRDEYSRIKSEQIANLGFIGRRYYGRFTLLADTELEIADIMLGLKKGKVQNFTSTEMRWDIPLPHLYAETAEILITPQPQSGEITVKNDSTNESVNLSINIVRPAVTGFADDRFRKIRMFNEFIEFIFERESSSLSFSVEGLNQSPLSLRQHLLLNKTLRILHDGKGSIWLRDKKKRVLLAEFENAASDELACELVWTREILEGLQTIVDAAGGVEVRCTVAHINSQIHAIKFVRDLIRAPETVLISPIKLSPTGEFPPTPEDVETLVIGYLFFENIGIAFCAISRANITRDDALVNVQVMDMKAREITWIDLDTSCKENFRKEMEAETGLQLILEVNSSSIFVD